MKCFITEWRLLVLEIRFQGEDVTSELKCVRWREINRGRPQKQRLKENMWPREDISEGRFQGWIYIPLKYPPIIEVRGWNPLPHRFI